MQVACQQQSDMLWLCLTSRNCPGNLGESKFQLATRRAISRLGDFPLGCTKSASLTMSADQQFRESGRSETAVDSERPQAGLRDSPNKGHLEQD